MSIPTSIMAIKKCRENPDDILFIDASQYFEKVASKMFKNAGYYCKLFQCQPS
jgi:type I restriction enzyme M protein